MELLDQSRRRPNFKPAHGSGRLPQSVAAAGLALFLLVSILSTQFSATNHELTTLHAICPQHGELLDVDDRDSANAGGVATSADSRFGLSSTPARGHHQHCLFVSSRGNRSIFKLNKPQVEPLAKPRVAVAFARAESQPVSTAIHLLAPKHSPPSA
jgi:hypothetical protein